MLIPERVYWIGLFYFSNLPCAPSLIGAKKEMEPAQKKAILQASIKKGSEKADSSLAVAKAVEIPKRYLTFLLLLLRWRCRQYVLSLRNGRHVLLLVPLCKTLNTCPAATTPTQG